MNYYPRFPGDYMRKTMHLSMLEDGAYGRLLDWYYANDRAIPHDRRYAVSRATSQAERVAVDSVLSEFFTQVDGSHRNDRCDNEIAAAAKRIATAKENGSKGGRRPKSNPAGNPPDNPLGNPVGNPLGSDPLTQQQSSPTPSPNSLRSEEKPGAKAPSSPAEPTTDDDDSDSGAEELDDLPACPHRRLIALYREKLPTLTQPRVELWDGKNQANMRARWRWVLTSKREDGRRYAESVEEAVAWFGIFFDTVSESDFLCGRSNSDFACDLEWLVKAANFSKVVNGRYLNRAPRGQR